MADATTVFELAAKAASNVGDRLTEQAARTPDEILLTTESRSISYAKLDELSNAYAAGFQRIGITKHDVVCQMLPNCEAFVVNWLALAKLGAVQAPINPEFTGAALLRLLNLTEATVLVLDSSLQASVAAIAGELEHLEQIVLRGSTEFALEPALSRFSLSNLDVLNIAGSGPPGVIISYADPLMLLFTSGTTGASKAVEISHRYALHYAAEYIEHWEITADDVMYTAYPLFHVDASVSTFLVALHCGCRAVVMSRFSVSRFWDDIRNFGGTITTFMGAVATFLYEREPNPNDAHNSLRLALVAPVPAFWREFEIRFGIKVVAGYGSTEACFPCWGSPHEPHRDDTFGKPCEHWELRIGDSHDEALPVNITGEILVRPKRPYTMMTGYYKNPAATAETWRNLWHHSGDLGFLDEDGSLHFVGRLKDAIRRRGENISAFEVEEVLDGHPDVLETAVIGVPSEYTEEDVKVVVVLRGNVGCSAEDIISWAKGRLPRYALPRYVEFMDELPTTETSKVRKHELRDAWHNAQTFDLERGQYLSDRPLRASHPIGCMNTE